MQEKKLESIPIGDIWFLDLGQGKIKGVSFYQIERSLMKLCVGCGGVQLEVSVWGEVVLEHSSILDCSSDLYFGIKWHYWAFEATNEEIQTLVLLRRYSKEKKPQHNLKIIHSCIFIAQNNRGSWLENFRAVGHSIYFLSLPLISSLYRIGKQLFMLSPSQEWNTENVWKMQSGCLWKDSFLFFVLNHKLFISLYSCSLACWSYCMPMFTSSMEQNMF